MLLWKLLVTGALSGLVLGSILMMVVVYRLAPLLQSRRQRSLRDQHQMPIPRFGGVGMAWAFFVYGFPKSDLGNIRGDEEEQFKKAAKLILALSDDQIRQLIENGQFEEVKKDG